jgi:hypothetical protein
MHNNTLCIKKSYLKRFFSFTNELMIEYVIIKKGYRSGTTLFEFKTLPIKLKNLIKSQFGTYENPKMEKNQWVVIERLSGYLISEMNKKRVTNIKTSEGII